MSGLQAGTPAAQGYRMPAEWARHEATWIAWPHNASDWPGRFQPIPWVYCEIVRALARGERVEILVQDEAAAKRAGGMLRRAGVGLGNVRFHVWRTNRIWTRDSGPIFVTREQDERGARELAVTDWRFNAWAKYDDWQLDDALPGRAAELLGVARWQPEVEGHRVVLEGGSIDTNGAGVLLTTEECLLSNVQARNPGLHREQLERVFAEYLGMKQVIWLKRGIAGDDTHGHVDDITRFTDENTIVTAVEPNAEDENHEPLAENLERLRTARNLRGEPYRVVTLPCPLPVVFEGQRLPASYANFYIANGVVIVPTFNDPSDRIALQTLAELFPAHTVQGIHCGDFIWGLGALHCMTQQQPAVD